MILTTTYPSKCPFVSPVWRVNYTKHFFPSGSRKLAEYLLVWFIATRVDSWVLNRWVERNTSSHSWMTKLTTHGCIFWSAKVKFLVNSWNGNLLWNKCLTTERIRYELIVPKNPGHNGAAERLNRTLVENVRSILTDAQLPYRFWAEALSTAVFLRNRRSTSTVHGMMPFQAWSGKKPSMNNLRVFGCATCSHIPKDERRKLNLKARRCIFLGYGDVTKGYRLYDLIKTHVFHSRDVVFDETSLGCEKEQTKDLEGVNLQLKLMWALKNLILKLKKNRLLIRTRQTQISLMKNP